MIKSIDYGRRSIVMSKGFIKIHRSILDWEWYQESKTVHIFLHLLLNTNYKTKKWQGMEINRGEFITSLSSISQDTGLTISEVRTRLGRLENTGEIQKRSTNKYTRIRMCNYSEYQDRDSKNKGEKSTNILTNNNTTMKHRKEQRTPQTNHNQITTTNKDNKREETKSANQDSPEEYLKLSLSFHKQQKENGFYHKDFKHELNYKSKIVIDGASTIDKLVRLDQEDLKDIKHTLDFVLNDEFWMQNVISLNSIRKKSSRNGNSKYFNIKNRMLKTGQSKKYTLSDINKMGIKPNQIDKYFIQTSNNQYKPTTKGKSLITKEK